MPIKFSFSLIWMALIIGGFMLIVTSMPWASDVPAERDAAEFDAATVPSPELTPFQVVRLQLNALRHNDPHDSGIDLTYSFASPANKAAIGPVRHFAAMLRAAPYDRLVNHRSVRYGSVSTAGYKAYQPILVTDLAGEEIGYVWVLTRQQEGACQGCWMTDAVYPARPVTRRKLVSV